MTAAPSLERKLFGKSSPYIRSFTYDLDERTLTIFLMKGSKSDREVKFEKINSFEETMFEGIHDDDYIDSIIGIHMIKNGQY